MLKVGDKVVLTCAGRSIAAEIQVASRNGRSLVLQYEGIVDGFIGHMPVFKGDDDRWRSIADLPVEIDADPRKVAEFDD